MGQSSPRTAEREVLVVREAMFRNAPGKFMLYLALLPFGIGAIALLVWWLRCRSSVLTITNRRSVLRRGILGKSTTEVMHAHVRNVQLSQSILQRLFGVGSLGISSAGQAGIEIMATGIADPQGTKDVIDFYRDNPDASGSPPTTPVAKALTGFAAFAAGVFVIVGASAMITVIVGMILLLGGSGEKTPTRQITATSPINPAAAPEIPKAKPATPPVETARDSIEESAAGIEPESSGPDALDEPPPKDDPRADDDSEAKRERSAMSKLTAAKGLKAANPNAYKRRLKEVVDQFPGTAAAKDASELLRTAR